jgi:hypothetical protein
VVADAQFRDGALPPGDDLPLAERELERVAAVVLVKFCLLACVDIDR